MVYREADQLKLPDVTGSRSIYDFLGAVKSFDSQFTTFQEGHIALLAETNQKLPSIYDMLERYRNHRHVTQVTSAVTKAPSHSAFATLQGEKPTDSSSTPPRQCLCGELHYFSQCPYLIPSKRNRGWKADREIQKAMDEKIENNSGLKRAIQYA